jgi:hypothetical protein
LARRHPDPDLAAFLDYLEEDHAIRATFEIQLVISLGQTPSPTRIAELGVPRATQVFLEETGGRETPLTGGIAKWLAAQESLAGMVELGRRDVPARTVEMYVLATETGLFVVFPGARIVHGWNWQEDIISIQRGRRFWKFGGLVVDTVSEGTVQLRMPANVADRVLEVWLSST